MKIGFSTIAIKIRKKINFKDMSEEKLNDTKNMIDKLFNDKSLDVAILKSKSELIIVTKYEDYYLNNIIASKLLMWKEKEITIGQNYSNDHKD